MLLFDSGDCAVLQRDVTNNTNKDSMTVGAEKQWADVNLPSIVPDDPIVVVNIADCLSELSENYLPSTLHRVMPDTGTSPRNCLALFVGLDPQEKLTFNRKAGATNQQEVMSYEDWRKKRIEKSQKVFQMINKQ